MGTNVPTISPAAGAVKNYVNQNAKVLDRLGAGIQAGFAVLSIKGKEWSIKHRGEITSLYRDGTREPLQTIEVVIIDAAPNLSRTFYEDQNKYVDGSSAAPDCASIDNVKPDAGVPKPQAALCATCPKSMWGSRITPEGKKAKACQENKRLAVTDFANIDNEAFGGPMLLRVPVMSHGDLAAYGARLKAAGVPSFAVATRIGFQAGKSHPQLTFTYGSTLSEEEALQAIALIDDPRTLRILNDAAEQREVEPAPAAEPIQPTSLSQKAIDAAIARAQGSKPAPETAPAEEPAPKVDHVAEAQALAAQALAAAAPAAPVEPAPKAEEPASTPAPAAKKSGLGAKAQAIASAPKAAVPATPAAPASFDKLMDGLLETQG